MADLAPALWGIPVVAGSAERSALFPTPANDQRVFNKSTGAIERWTGSIWAIDLGSSSLGTFDLRSAPYNAVGDGVADDTAAILAAVAAIQAAGGGVLRGRGTFKVTGVPGAPLGPALFTFTGLTGIVIDLRGALVSDAATYTGTNEAILFDFINCRDIDIRGRFQSAAAVTTNPATTHAGGLIVARFSQGCKNVFVDVDITGCKAGCQATRLWNDPITYRSSQFRGRIVASGCYYPWLAQFSGDDAELSIDTDTCGRSFFIYGTSNQRLNVRVKNQQVTSILGAYSGFGCRDIRIDFADQNSDTNQAAAPRIQFGWGDSTPATHANIDLRLDVLNPVGSPFGNTLEFMKFLDGGTTPDNVGRGHVLDGFRLSGNSNQIPGNSHVTNSAGTWAAPDVCRNFAVRDFTGLGSGSPIQFSAATPVSQLAGRAVFENSSSQHNIYFFNGANGECIFIGCQALNFSNATTDTDKHTLISCLASDGTNQSVINKTFVNTFVGAALFKLTPQEGSFTPTITFGGASVGMTFGVQVGTYSRVGNRVFFDLFVVLTAKGSSAGAMAIAGLPFIANSGANKVRSVSISKPVTTGVTGVVTGVINPGQTTIALSAENNGNESGLTDANATATTQFVVSGQYDV